MRPLLLAASFLAGLLSACASVKPEATLVKITENPAEVAGCKNLGMVESSRPFVSPEDSRTKQMQTKTARLGGNVLFVPSYNVTGTGTAYLCGSRTTG
jgi:pectin methylesterase-like acyl-CoA thioesterase